MFHGQIRKLRHRKLEGLSAGPVMGGTQSSPPPFENGFFTFAPNEHLALGGKQDCLK